MTAGYFERSKKKPKNKKKQTEEHSFGENFIYSQLMKFKKLGDARNLTNDFFRFFD